jgi:hypothetical protein
MKKGFGYGQVLDRVLDKCPKHQIVQLPNTDKGYIEQNKRTNEFITFPSFPNPLNKNFLKMFTSEIIAFTNFKIPSKSSFNFI